MNDKKICENCGWYHMGFDKLGIGSCWMPRIPEQKTRDYTCDGWKERSKEITVL